VLSFLTKLKLTLWVILIFTVGFLGGGVHFEKNPDEVTKTRHAILLITLVAVIMYHHLRKLVKHDLEGGAIRLVHLPQHVKFYVHNILSDYLLLISTNPLLTREVRKGELVILDLTGGGNLDIDEFPKVFFVDRDEGEVRINEVKYDPRTLFRVVTNDSA
jgi:hypothetical protein